MSCLSISIFIFTIQMVSSSYLVAECDSTEDDFRCHNGGLCIQVNSIFNSTISKICRCKQGYTGKQCEQSIMSCSPDPCAPNGYCNSLPGDINASSKYFCRCKPGFTGINCKENINECLNATCYNGGLCIDGINSYECDCKWPFTGRYCQTKLKCNNSDLICKNNAKCIDTNDDDNNNNNGPICICKNGYEGVDCSIKIDKCKLKPCKNDGICINLPNNLLTSTSSSSSTFSNINNNEDDYICECPYGKLGKHCEYNDICSIHKPCMNNSTCINLADNRDDHLYINDDADSNSNSNYFCQCSTGYTGINCDIQVTTTTTTTSTTTKSNLSPTESTNSVTSTSIASDSPSIKNGSFVLVVNISPNEFRSRQNEIIREFENRFGILMIIDTEPNTHNQMIYPFNPLTKQIETVWTKVYFKIIFACMFDTQDELNSNIIKTITTSTATVSSSSPQIKTDKSTDNTNNNKKKTLCLQNNLNNLNDVFEIISQIKKQSSLLPKYVSNITYEAYSDSLKSNRNDINVDDGDETRRNNNNNDYGWNSSTFISVILVLVILSICVILGLGILIKLNSLKKIKAPIWYPPSSISPNDPYSSQITNKQIDVMISSNKSGFSRTFDELFNRNMNNKHNNNNNHNNNIEMSPTNSDSACDINQEKPVKMRKLDLQIYSSINNLSSASSSGSTTTTTTNSGSNTPSLLILPPPPPPHPIQSSTANHNTTPDYYPSPPESLPDNHQKPNLLNPVNYKATSNGVTPLMLFIIGKSKSKTSSHQQQLQQQQYDQSEIDLINSFVSNGADLNITNIDGETALHIAARCGLYQICDRLLKLGSDLNIYDNYGRNVLHTAVCSNEKEIVKLILNYCSTTSSSSNTNTNNINNSNNILIDDKLDIIDSKTNDDLGDTSLIIASRLNFNEIIQILIDFNVTINSTDNEGRSALHWCAKVNNVNGALLLLQSGANVNMQDNDEKTPLSSALNELYTKDVVELLIKFDAFLSSEDEIKYNKMKLIIDNLSQTNSNLYQTVNINHKNITKKINQNNINNSNMSSSNNKITKSNQLNNGNSNNPIQTQSTKRKISEISSQVEQSSKQQSSNLKMKTKQKSNQNQTVYTPLTPSPPLAKLPQLQQQHQLPIYNQYISSASSSNPNYGEFSNNYYSTSTCDLTQFGYNYQLNQNEYSQIGHTINASSNGNINMGYLNDMQSSNKYLNGSNTHIYNQTFYIQQPRAQSPSTTMTGYPSEYCFNNNLIEPYSAYF